LAPFTLAGVRAAVAWFGFKVRTSWAKDNIGC